MQNDTPTSIQLNLSELHADLIFRHDFALSLSQLECAASGILKSEGREL